MYKAISYWCFDGGIENTCPIEDACRQAAEAGYQGIELAIDQTGVLTTQSSESDCRRIRETVAQHDLRLETVASGMSWAVSPTDNDASVRERALALSEAALQRVAWLGAEAMLYIPGAITIPWIPDYGPVAPRDAYRWAREGVERLARSAEAHGVDLCIENVWNGMFYSAVELADFVDAIGSERVGVYFDLGNVLGYHQHVPHWIDELGQRIKRVHVKDFQCAVGNLDGFCPLGEGDVPWEQCMAALRGIGYEHGLVAELIPPVPVPAGGVQRASEALDRILDRRPPAAQ